MTGKRKDPDPGRQMPGREAWYRPSPALRVPSPRGYSLCPMCRSHPARVNPTTERGEVIAAVWASCQLCEGFGFVPDAWAMLYDPSEPLERVMALQRGSDRDDEIPL